jgi:hypothetical protein
MLPVSRLVAPCSHVLAFSDAIPQRITYLQIKRKVEIKQAILPLKSLINPLNAE